MEINPEDFLFNQNESEFLFENQAEPQLSSFSVESPDVPIGQVIPSIEAVDWHKKGLNVDIRPRLIDSSTGEARLLDSGAQLSATVRGPNDKLDESVKLVAVNGSRIPTYGSRELVIKMGRKTYKIKAIICDVKQDILGFDFVTKYKLGLEWDDFDQRELFLVDKKAKIKSRVQIITVPSNLTRTHHVESLEPPAPSSSSSRPSSVPSDDSWFSKVSSAEVSAKRVATTLFEVACVKRLGESPESPESLPVETNEALKLHDEKYAKMVQAHPELLKVSFQKGKPVHNVWHKIETADHPPCKAKRRPVLANKEKDRMGREAW